MNYEVPTYEDALSKFPPKNIPLETKDCTYYFFSSDPLKGELTYSTDPHIAANLEILSPKRVFEIIELNKQGKKVDTLGGRSTTNDHIEIGYQNVVGQDDLTRFDKKRTTNSDKPRNNKSHDKKETQRSKTDRNKNHHHHNK